MGFIWSPPTLLFFQKFQQVWWILSRGTTGNLLMLWLLYTNCRRYLIGCCVCLSGRKWPFCTMTGQCWRTIMSALPTGWWLKKTWISWSTWTKMTGGLPLLPILDVCASISMHLNALTLSFDITTTYKTPPCVLCVDVQNSFSKRQRKGYFKILTVLMTFTEFPADSVKIRWLKIF